MRPLAFFALVACTASTDSADTADTGQLKPGDVVLGATCPYTDLLGTVALNRAQGVAYLGGQLFDKPNPWIGAPALSTETCGYHFFDQAACPQCAQGEVCDGSACVAQPRAFTDLKAEITGPGGANTFECDPDNGMIWGEAGPVDDAYTMRLTFGGQSIDVPELALAAGDVEVTVTTTGDSMAPGALDASWEASDEGGQIASLIPMNHHAGTPTFTACAADASATSFHADAEMINPLAAITGLEFQGVEHVNVAAAQTELGCVELRYGGPTTFSMNE